MFRQTACGVAWPAIGSLALLTVCATGVSGCASWFQSQLAGTQSSPKVAVVDCKPATANVSSASQLATNVSSVGLAFSSPQLQNLSDLQRGIALITSSGNTSAATATATPEARLSAEISASLGLNLAQFIDDAALLDEDGAAAAERAHASAATTSLMSLRSADVASISRRDWQDLTQTLSRATATSGWTADLAKSLGAASRAGPTTLAASLSDVQKKYFLATYMKAYFRNGQIFELNFNGQDLKTQLLNKLGQKITDQQVLHDAGTEIDTVTNAFEAKLCGQNANASSGSPCSILGVIGQETFVTRAGKSYGFPGVTATLDPVGSRKVSTNKIKTDDIIEDLVRVFFEAEGDALARVPGVANSTMCKEMHICATQGQASVVEKANTAGDATEAGTTTVVSMVIRGGWLFSLNNEALAQSITTAVAVTARKVAEEAAWNKANGSACAASSTSSGAVHRDIAVTLKQ